jgi:hypothetical protein
MSKFTAESQPENKGRKPGSKNKISAEVKELVKTYLESNFEVFQASMTKLRPGAYVQAYLKLLQLIMPTKLEAKVNYENLSDSDLDQIVQTIIQTHESNTTEPES